VALDEHGEPTRAREVQLSRCYGQIWRVADRNGTSFDFHSGPLAGVRIERCDKNVADRVRPRKERLVAPIPLYVLVELGK